MRREVRIVDEARGIVQTTLQDERWYHRAIDDGNGGVINDYVPSVTWICDVPYPKGPQLLRWVAKHGWDEAEEIKGAAGDQGSKVHQAINRIVSGGTVDARTDTFENPRSGQQEPLNAEEAFRIWTFCQWFEVERPQVIAHEITGWNERYRYAGTLDLLACLKSDKYKFPRIIDYKISSQIWPSMELQVSAYKHFDTPFIPKNTRLGILQLGYKKNKNQKYKFTPVADQFPLFLSARKIWEKETKGQQPAQREYPVTFSVAHLMKPC